MSHYNIELEKDFEEQKQAARFSINKQLEGLPYEDLRVIEQIVSKIKIIKPVLSLLKDLLKPL